MSALEESEVKISTLNYFDGNELSTSVWMSKYALKDKEGNFLELNPDDMHKRLAKEFARIEGKYPNALSEDQIFDLLKGFRYIIPQGSPMAGIGNPYQIMSLSNCIVIEGAEDSYGGICYTDQEQAQLMKRRCGVGHDISKLRPKGFPTENAAKTTDGIEVFMERFSNTTREVAQNGRRGALMLTISVHHPEILTFIQAKHDLKKVTGANISIRLSDEFMNAVKNNQDYEVRWPVNSKKPEISANVNAKDIWNEIINSAWKSAEPGLIYWDNVINNSPADSYKENGFETKSTNPCSELPLSSYDSCRLLLLNLTSYIENPFKANANFNYVKFKEHAKIAQRLMDDIIDLELECIEKILEKIDSDPESNHIKKIEKDLWIKLKDNCENGRRTGLGITGLGDTLAGLGIKYGSKKSIEITEGIYNTLCIGSYESSINLAEERGHFPIWNKKKEISNPFIKRVYHLLNDEYKKKYSNFGRRNIANLTTAPCGSVSMVAQLFNSGKFNTTSGIEPAFLLSYKRRKKIQGNEEATFIDDLGDKWIEYNVYHAGFEYWKNVTGKTDDEIEKSPYYGATSNNVDWKKSVDIQASAQKWVDHAISKTCNLPNNATKKLVAEVYMDAWEKGCKGFTVYRDGCRSGVLISENTKVDNQSNDAEKRPGIIDCDIFHISRNKQPYTIIVGLLKSRPYEVFAIKNNNNTIPTKLDSGKLQKLKRRRYKLILDNDELSPLSAFTDQEDDSLTRMVSLALRHNTPIEFIQHQLEKTEGDLNSLAKCLSRALKKYVPNGTKVYGEECPNCSAVLVRQEGCIKCNSCEFTKC